MNTKHLKKSPGEVLFDIVNITLLTIITLLALYPMLHVLFSSISDAMGLTRHVGPVWRPVGFSLDSFRHTLQNPNIRTGYRNTMLLLLMSVPWSVFMTSLGAYFLAQKGVMWKTPITIFIMFTMFFSGGMIPFFLTLRDLQLTGTLWGLVFPFSIGTFNLIIMRTSFQSIDYGMSESAMMDGAGHFRILFLIIYPLSKAVLAVMVLFYGVGTWNGWFWAGVILRNREQWPLQVVLREILLTQQIFDIAGGVGDQEALGRTLRYATIVVSTVPILLVYPLIQKHFVKGVMIGALKG